VTNRLTLGGRAEASRDLVSLGPSLNLRLGLGEIETAGAVSGGRDGYGTAVLAGYTFAAQPVNAGASVMAASDAYTVVNARPAEQRSALEASVYGSVAIRSGVSLTAQHSQSSLHGGLSRYRTSLLSTVHGSRSVQLTASVARTGDENGRGYEAYAGLSLQLGRTSTTTSVAANRIGASVAVDAQSPLPVGIGYGYQARVESGTPGSASGTVQYQGEYGRYEVRHDVVGENRRSSASAAGSIVAIGGSLFASRPVSQSFALVRVPGVEGVRGFASNQEVGRTNASGDLLVPDLQPYYGNLLNISDSDIPLDYSVGHVRLTLALPFRGGALAVFPVQLIRRVTGTMRIGDGATERVPEYGEIRVTPAGAPAPIVSPLGGAGEFYFENLPDGQLDAVVQDSQGTCAFVLEVPDADEPLVHLGEIRCATQEPPR
jgi:outer membrane usher protein